MWKIIATDGDKKWLFGLVASVWPLNRNVWPLIYLKRAITRLHDSPNAPIQRNPIWRSVHFCLPQNDLKVKFFDSPEKSASIFSFIFRNCQNPEFSIPQITYSMRILSLGFSSKNIFTKLVENRYPPANEPTVPTPNPFTCEKSLRQMVIKSDFSAS